VRHLRTARGFSFLELLLVLSLIGILLALAYNNWRGYTAQQRLRYGTAQVATDLREAQERAKEARVQYTVTFTAGSSAYAIAGGTFVENAQLPAGVSVTADEVVTFSAFGQPDAAHTLTVQNTTGSGTVTVTSMGGISYQAP
jgi:prepilin-type N-terminal cleavage/methylation domain-containing protein